MSSLSPTTPQKALYSFPQSNGSQWFASCSPLLSVVRTFMFEA